MKLTNRRFILPALFFTATISAALVFGARRADSEAQSPLAASTANARANPAKESVTTAFITTGAAVDQGDASVALLTIRPTGFEPKELTIPAGKTLVVVRNRTGLAEFSIRLERGNGTRLFDLRVPRYKRDWKKVLDLTPDTYVITESNHPGWVCRVTVTAS